MKNPISHAPLITLEGIDGSGKSLQAEKLAQNLRLRGHEVVLVRDPGSSSVAERIRDILLDRNHHTMSSFTELFLYEAARSQLVSEVILPALQRNDIVVSDRFTDSTVAYQGYGRSLPLSFIDDANRRACGGVVPLRTYFLDIPWEESLHRRKRASATDDRMEREQEHFYGRVRKGYQAIAKKEKTRVRVIDGTQSVDRIEKDILEDVLTLVE